MLLFPDVERETRAYLLDVLGPRWPGLEITTDEVSETTDWQRDQPTMLVLSVSGPGSRVGVVYERVLIGVQVYAPTKSKASRLAAEVRSFLGDWPMRTGMVAGHSDNARPNTTSLDDVAYPSYWYSANLLFKAETLTLEGSD